MNIPPTYPRQMGKSFFNAAVRDFQLAQGKKVAVLSRAPDGTVACCIIYPFPRVR